jgi:hypothetical protein
MTYFVANIETADIANTEWHCNQANGRRTYLVPTDDHNIVYIHAASPQQLRAASDRLWDLAYNWTQEPAATPPLPGTVRVP